MNMEGGYISASVSVWGHALPVLLGCALRSVWLEGKVTDDILVMKTRDSSKKLIFSALRAAGAPGPALQAWPTSFFFFFYPNSHSNNIKVSLCHTFKKARTHWPRKPPPPSACSFLNTINQNFYIKVLYTYREEQIPAQWIIKTEQTCVTSSQIQMLNISRTPDVPFPPCPRVTFSWSLPTPPNSTDQFCLNSNFI